MRLRYFHVQKIPPLNKVSMPFGHEEILGRPGAIHFVVGVNGSGKSRMLQALAEVFLALESRTVPSFPTTLAWDIGTPGQRDQRTIMLYSPTGNRGQARLLDFGYVLSSAQLAQVIGENPGSEPVEPVGVMNYRRFDGTSLPGAAGFLPSVVLAYTSGAICNWETIFDTQLRSLAESFDPKEVTAEFSPRAITLNPIPENLNEASIGLLVTSDALRLALIVMAIAQSAEEFDDVLKTDDLRLKFIRDREEVKGNLRLNGFRGILDTIDWLWSVTLRIRVEKPDNAFSGRTWESLNRIATTRIREPRIPDNDALAPRSLYFDLRTLSPREETEKNTARAILDVLGGSALSAFRTLYTWHRQGLIDIRDMLLVLRKRGIDNLIQLDALSDGERVFVGRMALFYLLRDEKDALVLLDEPETHFNDFWKRQMVDIVDDSLGDDPNDVVLTTHSSIALTDAFASEVTVLQNDNGQVTAKQPRIQTFGASPTEILQDVFNAPDSIGQRASEYLDMVLLLTEKPFAVEEWWNGNTNVLPELQAHVEQMYIEREEQTPEPARLYKRITEVLEALRQISRDNDQNQNGNILSATQQLYEKLGSGYYRFEFDHRLDSLRSRTPGQRSEGE